MVDDGGLVEGEDTDSGSRVIPPPTGGFYLPVDTSGIAPLMVRLGD